MEIEPYSIYYENRPFKVAFLVNIQSKTEELTDLVIEYNREKWGGRFNPIIPTDGITIKKDYWKFLRGYDPDIIFTTVELDNVLRKKIQIFLTPLRVETIKDIKQPFIQLSEDPISISPTKATISKISRSFFEEESTLVYFEFGKKVSSVVRKFVLRNFGTYETGRTLPTYLKNALDKCNTKVFTIKSIASLNKALLEIGDFRNKYVFPSQICATTNHVKNVEHSDSCERFDIIIGDSYQETIYSWNRILNQIYWLREKITQLWLPEELASNPKLTEGLSKFINKYAEYIGKNPHRVNFVTFSVDLRTFQKTYKSLGKKIYHLKSIEKYKSPLFPHFAENYPGFILKRGLDFFRANTTEQHLTINEPEISEENMGGQYWFTDLYIQYRPETFVSIIGKNHLWQLPRRNSLLSDLRFFNKPARINELGTFSILMKRKSSFEPDENLLIVHLPSDKEIFGSLICGNSYQNFDSDQREAFLSRPYYTTRTSLMGKPLRGILSLFSDLHSVYSLIGERYIRTMFEIMSNKRSYKDAKLVESLLTDFKRKKLGTSVNLTTDDGLRWLAEKTIKISKDLGNKEKTLLFSEFLTVAEQETAEYNIAHKTNKFKVNKEDIQNKLTDLIRSRILLSGITTNCPRCGEKNWYSINNIKQEVVCNGCQYEFVVPAEQRWSYKLNSMVRSAFTEYGTIPILLVLGQLFMEARGSFMFIPCTDLITKTTTNKYRTETDLDIVCIVDGEFIIGEVKQSIDGFAQSDFDKIQRVAKQLKPDRVIFSSLSKEGSYSTTKKNWINARIAELQRKLNCLEIRVEMYNVYNNILDPAPVSSGSKTAVILF